MSEYIITSEQIEELNRANGGMQIVTSWLSAYAIFDTSEFPPLMKFQHLAITLPNIVRCRDCRFADWDITAWWCTRDKHYPFEIGELRGYGERSHLVGFCAWAERREP